MRCFLGMTFLAVSFCGMAAEPETPIDIGGRKQLFLDGRMIRSSENAQVRFHEPYQSGDLLVWADQPWESGPGAYVCGGCSVLKEDSKVRLWYDVVLGEQRPGIDSERGLAYAESTDGIHFTKPVLGLCEHRGSTENNLVIPSYIAGGSVWIDPKDPANPYKSQTFNRDMQLVLFQSPDGLHWSEARRWDVGHCDTQSIVFWDQAIGRYVLYTRRWVGGATPGAEYRIVRRLESNDLVSWDGETVVMQADARDLAIYRTVTGQPPMDYYGAAVFRYPDADGLYLMLTQPFWHWRQYPQAQQWGDTGAPQLAQYERLGPSTIDARLAVSRDGKQFQHGGERAPFLRLGPEGSYYSRMVFPVPNPVRMGDELWFYFYGMNRDHEGFVDPAAEAFQGGIGRAILRLDGFALLEAGYEEGEVVTPLVRFAGERLEVNLDTAGGGYALVELLDDQGRPIPGYTRDDATPLWGNSVRMPVTWGGRNADRQDVGPLAGQPISIRFVLRDCRLYAFQFVEGERGKDEAPGTGQNP